MHALTSVCTFDCVEIRCIEIQFRLIVIIKVDSARNFKMSTTNSSVECRYCSRCFASTYSRKRHEYLRHRDSWERENTESDTSSVVTDTDKDSVVTEKSSIADVIVPHTDSDSEKNESDTDSNVNSDDGNEKNVWRILLNLLGDRIKNNYYHNTNLNQIENIDQLWDPPFYKELVHRLRNLVNGIRRINKLLMEDAVMGKIDEKVENIREKYKDDDLLNEYGVKEMAWEKLDYLIKATLQRNKDVLGEYLFEVSDEEETDEDDTENNENDDLME